jgi:hypothetical protein
VVSEKASLKKRVTPGNGVLRRCSERGSTLEPSCIRVLEQRPKRLIKIVSWRGSILQCLPSLLGREMGRCVHASSSDFTRRRHKAQGSGRFWPCFLSGRIQVEVRRLTEGPRGAVRCLQADSHWKASMFGAGGPGPPQRAQSHVLQRLGKTLATVAWVDPGIWTSPCATNGVLNISQ